MAELPEAGRRSTSALTILSVVAVAAAALTCGWVLVRGAGTTASGWSLGSFTPIAVVIIVANLLPFVWMFGVVRAARSVVTTVRIAFAGAIVLAGLTAWFLYRILSDVSATAALGFVKLPVNLAGVVAVTHVTVIVFRRFSAPSK